MSDKIRLDILMVEKNLAESRSKAQALIMAGKVVVNDHAITKAGTQIHKDADIRLKGNLHPYVSRGGLKLEKALKEFPVSPEGLAVLDVGASTGGFTHCLLLNGAKYVHALDVGYGQLHWTLRQDERVNVIERTNIRNIKKGDLSPEPQMAVADVSFISILKIIPVLFEILPPSSPVITLIKPQFEAGRHRIGKGGVVRDEKTREEIVNEVIENIEKLGTVIKGRITSPIKGPKGNVEYLIWFETP